MAAIFSLLVTFTFIVSTTSHFRMPRFPFMRRPMFPMRPHRRTILHRPLIFGGMSPYIGGSMLSGAMNPYAGAAGLVGGDPRSMGGIGVGAFGAGGVVAGGVRGVAAGTTIIDDPRYMGGVGAGAFGAGGVVAGGVRDVAGGATIFNDPRNMGGVGAGAFGAGGVVAGGVRGVAGGATYINDPRIVGDVGAGYFGAGGMQGAAGGTTIITDGFDGGLALAPGSRIINSDAASFGIPASSVGGAVTYIGDAPDQSDIYRIVSV